MYLNLGGTNHATRLLLFLIYYTQDFFPQLTTKERDQQIKKRYQAGEGLSALPRVFGISPQRVDQIVKSIKGSGKLGIGYERDTQYRSHLPPGTVAMDERDGEV